MAQAGEISNGECPYLNGSSKSDCISGKVFQSACQIFVHTGNLTNWSRTTSKVVKSTTDEICENIITAVNSSSPSQDEKFSKQKSVRFSNKALMEKVKNEERSTLKVSVKIYLNEENPRDLQEAIFRNMTELGVDLIDVVILSIPPFINTQDHFPKIQLMWKELEKLVEQQYVGGLAVCDFDKNALEQLCKTAKIKPIVDQINLVSCCVMPKDLIEFAEKEGIQLLTHADPKDILPSSKLFDKINNSYEFPEPVKNWRYSWVTCYSVIIRCRTILQNKGYVVNLVRDMQDN